MTIRRAGLALVVIAAVGTANGKAQIVETSPQRLGNTSTLRIAPLAGQGPVQNGIDLLNLRRADAAIVPSTVATRNSSLWTRRLRSMSLRGSFHGRVSPQRSHRRITSASS